MKDPEKSMEKTFRDSDRWIWLCAFTVFAIAALSSGRLLAGSGMLLLGVFAYNNNPFGRTSTATARPTPVLIVSWACGLFGVMAIVVAAVRAWL